MSNPKLFQLSISQFAKLCHASRKTLIYYDNIGLLSPLGRSEQGYRYYAATQATQYQMIQLLKSSNCSLEEIKEIVTNPATHNDIPIMKEQKAGLTQQRDLLNMYISYADTMLRVAEEAEDVIKEKPFLLYRNYAEYFFMSALPPTHLREDKMFHYVDQHTNYIIERKEIMPYPLSVLVNVDSYPNETENCVGICHRYVDRKKREKDEFTYIMPVGHYIACKSAGNWKAVREMNTAMYHFAKENNYKIIGNFLNTGTVFDYDMEGNEGFCTSFLPVSVV